MGAIDLLDGELVSNIASGEITAIPIEAADCEGEAMPFDELLEVELHTEAEVVGVGETLAHAADRIAGDVVRVAGGNFHAAVIKHISNAPPVAGESISVKPLARADVIGRIGIIIRPEPGVAEHRIRRVVADRSAWNITGFLGRQKWGESSNKQEGEEGVLHGEEV